MQKCQVFQPFTDRLSRDIRNALSRSFVTVLQQKSISSAQSVAQQYLNDGVEPCYQEYIRNRLVRYNTVLAKLGDENPEPLLLALLLWDEQLFFEVHEVLEHVWLEEKGEEKLFLQAMIRAAGVYIKLEAGYPHQASRIAAKAIPVLHKNQHRLARYGQAQLLLNALATPSLPPPKLLQQR